MDRAEVHFSEERNPRIAAKEVCEVSLDGHGHHVRCKAAAADGFAAVDLAVEKLEHQLYKLKSKLVPRKARRGDAEPVATDDDDQELVDQPLSGPRAAPTRHRWARVTPGVPQPRGMWPTRTMRGHRAAGDIRAILERTSPVADGRARPRKGTWPRTLRCPR